ncbi:MAG: hypothetical protein CMM46_11600 [Rhodospirillaceae bacterium]|nr:hypothetical protein [Rhodospirillaceae bacterium]|tara:strand:- start:4234 stop:4449 length:216 start_codon:yes stop_codon:yes gene_type:complete
MSFELVPDTPKFAFTEKMGLKVEIIAAQKTAIGQNVHADVEIAGATLAAVFGVDIDNIKAGIAQEIANITA